MHSADLEHRYRGQVAAGYDARRSASRKWMNEQEAVDRFLSQFAAGSTILDIPVGTGRFLALHKKHKLVATGIDVSPDMLGQAQRKATELDLSISLGHGDIRAIGAAAASFDVVVCIRFLNWIDTAAFDTVIRELTRVSRGYLILGVRTYVRPAELKMWSLLQMAGWLSWRVRRALRSQLFVHEPEDVRGAFSRNRLQVRSKALVDRHAGGTEYNIYLLERVDPAKI